MTSSSRGRGVAGTKCIGRPTEQATDLAREPVAVDLLSAAGNPGLPPGGPSCGRANAPVPWPAPRSAILEALPWGQPACVDGSGLPSAVFMSILSCNLTPRRCKARS